MEQTDTEERVEGPMSDGEYIRKVDIKQRDLENDIGKNLKDDPEWIKESSSHLVSEMLRQECIRDFKLEPSSVAMNNVARLEFPFNRHTVTIGVGNEIVDFETARKDHEKIKEEQDKFAEEIEKVKEEMEKVRIIEKAWYDDFLNDKYINDLSVDRSRGIGDACAARQESFSETIEKQKDKNGILHVRDVNKNDGESDATTVNPKGRYMVPYREKVTKLSKVSL